MIVSRQVARMSSDIRSDNSDIVQADQRIANLASCDAYDAIHWIYFKCYSGSGGEPGDRIAAHRRVAALVTAVA